MKNPFKKSSLDFFSIFIVLFLFASKFLLKHSLEAASITTL